MKTRQVKFECSGELQPGSTALTFYSAREHTGLHSQPELGLITPVGYKQDQDTFWGVQRSPGLIFVMINILGDLAGCSRSVKNVFPRFV